MILIKLQEALAEVDAQRKALDEVEIQLRAMIAKLSGTPDITTSTLPSFAHAPRATRVVRDGTRDKIDEIADVIRMEGKPLHITKIAACLSMLGKEVSRTQIEPGLNRHVAKTKKARIAKFGPSIFGLAEWKGKGVGAHQ